MNGYQPKRQKDAVSVAWACSSHDSGRISQINIVYRYMSGHVSESTYFFYFVQELNGRYFKLIKSLPNITEFNSNINTSNTNFTTNYTWGKK